MIWTWTFLKALISHLNDGGALKVELVTAGIIILLAILAPRLAQSYFVRLESKLRQVASNRRLSVIIIGLLAFGTSAIRSSFIQFPQPSIQDEFSYLLAADTFAHGRLTNPSHPLSVHFETFHVIQKPTYASKYPPGQGLFLAFGQIVSGYPIVGVWITIALACAAICWMLLAYVSPGWAFTGAFLAMVRMVMLGQVPPSTVAGYWSQSFWGGSGSSIRRSHGVRRPSKNL